MFASALGGVRRVFLHTCIDSSRWRVVCFTGDMGESELPEFGVSHSRIGLMGGPSCRSTPLITSVNDFDRDRVVMHGVDALVGVLVVILTHTP